MAGETDFIADLGSFFLYPGIGRIGEHFATNERFDATFFQQRDLFCIPQIGVRLVLDDGRLAIEKEADGLLDDLLGGAK